MNSSRSHAVLFIFLMAAGCSLQLGNPVTTFRTQEDAGTVHVAVQSVAPFDEEYIEQLQPKIDPNDVTAATAIAQTQIRQLQQLRELLIDAGVALPSTTIDRTKVTTSGAATTDTATEKTTPPATDKVPTAPVSTSTVPDALSLPSGSPALDQALTFRALVALKQEVALLNRFVRDAAVSRGTKPYVVRLLVTLNPSAHFEPYNAYTTISLFSQTPETALPTYLRPETEKAARDLLSSRGMDLCGKAVEMIPLFVTDNVESSFENLAGTRNIGASGAASGVVNNIGASIGSRFRSQDVAKSQDRSVNALYTIARLSSNTMEARLGASVSGSSFVMVPRTYNVTVLVLVPTLSGYVEQASLADWSAKDRSDMAKQTSEIVPCREIAFTAVSRFSDARTGAMLTSQFADLAKSRLALLGAEWKLVSAKPTDLDALLAYAEYDNFRDFRSYLQTNNYFGNATLSPAAPAGEQTLWLDVVSISRNSGRAYGRFALPVKTTEFFTDHDTGTLLDDGDAARLTLSGARALTSSGVHATLTVTSDKKKTHDLQSTAITVDPDGEGATFVFPSPSKLLDKDKVENVRVTINRTSRKFEPAILLRWTGDSDPNANPPALTQISYLLTKKEPVKATVAMEVTAPHVIVTGQDSSGTVAIAFRSDDPKKAPTVRFNVSGGYIVSTTPSTTTDGTDHLGAGHGIFLVAVSNLAPGGKLTIRSFLDKSGARGAAIGEETIDVIAPPKPKETASK